MTITISKELLDELQSGVEWPEDLLDDNGLIKELMVRLMERMLGAQMIQKGQTRIDSTHDKSLPCKPPSV